MKHLFFMMLKNLILLVNISSRLYFQSITNFYTFQWMLFLMDKSNLTIQGEGKQEDIQKIILLYGLIKNRKKRQGFMFQFLKTQNWLSH
jgi:hypothetical protein